MSLTIDSYGPHARDNALPPAGDCGNLWVNTQGQMELDALAQNKTVAVSKIPFGAFVVGLLYAADAMGANTSVDFGIQTVDETVFDQDFFAGSVTSTAATKGSVGCVMPFLVTDPQGAYVVVTQTGSGTATGTVSAIPLYEMRGK